MPIKLLYRLICRFLVPSTWLICSHFIPQMMPQDSSTKNSSLVFLKGGDRVDVATKIVWMTVVSFAWFDVVFGELLNHFERKFC